VNKQKVVAVVCSSVCPKKHVSILDLCRVSLESVALINLPGRLVHQAVRLRAHSSQHITMHRAVSQQSKIYFHARVARATCPLIAASNSFLASQMIDENHNRLIQLQILLVTSSPEIIPAVGRTRRVHSRRIASPNNHNRKVGGRAHHFHASRRLSQAHRWPIPGLDVSIKFSPSIYCVCSVLLSQRNIPVRSPWREGWPSTSVTPSTSKKFFRRWH